MNRPQSSKSLQSRVVADLDPPFEGKHSSPHKECTHTQDVIELYMYESLCELWLQRCAYNIREKVIYALNAEIIISRQAAE